MGFIVIGYHYTTETNSKDILEHGLHPKDLSDIKACFSEHLDEKDKCIWVFTEPRSDEELTMVLLDMMTRHGSLKIVCLKVRYPKTNSIKNKHLIKKQKEDPSIEEVVITHTLGCGIINHRSPCDLITKAILPRQIKFICSWDFTNLDSLMETK